MDKETVDYFIEHTNVRLEKIETKLDSVLEFRWMILGGAVVFSGIFSVLTAGILTYLGK